MFILFIYFFLRNYVRLNENYFQRSNALQIISSEVKFYIQNVSVI